MGADTASLAFALRTLYPQKKFENTVYKNNPAFALMKKLDDFEGEHLALSTRYADSQGISATFSTAQANAGAAAGKKFLLTRVKGYGVAQITGEVIRASRSNKGSLLKAAQTEIDSVMNQLNRDLGISVFRNGTGSLGTVADYTNNVTTLADIHQITNFEVGMKLVGADTETGAILDSGAALTVTHVNRTEGKFTTTGAISGYGTGDHIYRQGDAYNNSAALKPSGFAAWVPTSAPSSADFFGVDRTADLTRLGGQRIDISAMPLAEGLMKAANLLAREGANPDYLFCNFNQLTNIQNELGTKGQIVDFKVGEIGFSSLRINGPTGAINIMADRNCPNGYAYMVQMDTWEFHHVGGLPGFLDDDGLTMLRQGTSDGYEVRLGYYGNIFCAAPGYNAVLTMPT